ncbi:MAG: DNA translocase FtsK [Patescibacteria group bacterium]
MRKKNKKQKKEEGRERGRKRESNLFGLAQRIKKQIFGVVVFLLALIVVFSFFDKAGLAGKIIFQGLNILMGRTIFILPLILVLGGLVFLLSPYDKFLRGALLAAFLLILGISAVFEVLNPDLKFGGYLGLISKPFLNFFGFWVAEIIFTGTILVGTLIFWHLFGQPWPKKSKEKENAKEAQFSEPLKTSFIKKLFLPKFKIHEIEPSPEPVAIKASFEATPKIPSKILPKFKYQLPPVDLLEADKGTPSAGDIRMDSAIIKKTLENFNIPVEMSEINIGPTVTQYTLKPADGIKLAKITTLSNDLALALANHPIRIEAPIPGKALVGIEVPNKTRVQVRLKNLISNPQFQNWPTGLPLCLGNDVSGNPIYSDLARMPHLLVAGATGTGKTIFLNSLIMSLLYHNSPEILRLIMVDPKRVEFPVYNDLPHLLCPIILDAQKTINALKWLVGEMERRFDVLSGEKTRDIKGYNEVAFKKEIPFMPYIVFVVDELADLMAARGKEMEAGIVRLAQMARAVGIHLVVATQRPSVEVITGLIKANITARITFQVASQIDSRTIIDAAGAEKLLGAGDLLFLSAEVTKPKRVQGAYVSEKEVRKTVEWINTENAKLEVEKIEDGILDNQMSQELAKTLETPENEFDGFYGEDPLYEESKRLVMEARKASASLLQRRLRIGYARAARLLDMLEDKGIVGPSDGAKPREIRFANEQSSLPSQPVISEEEVIADENPENKEWHKI